MKTIKNKETSIITREGDVDKKMTYVDLLKIIADVPPAQGYTIAEMRQRLGLYAALIAIDNKISLEDADFVVMKKLVQEFKWAQSHTDIIDFVDHIESL